jgi:MSHA biogenesis protein MshI
VYGLSIFKRRRSSDVRAGIATFGEAVAVAVVRRTGSQRPLVLHCGITPTKLGFADPALRQVLRDLNLGKSPISAVIGANDYQLAQIQAPEVPERELRAAARWRMREVIDFALDNATVDVFDVPASRGINVRRMLFAVATRDDVPQAIAASLQRLTNQLDVIDIPELCQRNLSALLPQDGKGVAFILLRSDYAQLVLTRAGQLYVARRLEYDQSPPSSSDASPDDSLFAEPHTFALELQRSLDYYETHFDQTPITDLILAPSGTMSESLAGAIAAQTGLRVHDFQPQEYVDLPAGSNDVAHWLATLALGAALRTTDGGA